MSLQRHRMIKQLQAWKENVEELEEQLLVEEKWMQSIDDSAKKVIGILDKRLRKVDG